MRILFALLVATVAFADEDSAEKAQARVLLGQGNSLFERGDLKGALVDFRAAYALYPSPKLLVNCAAAERELGDHAAAANDLRHYLDDAADDDPSLTERARGDLRALEKKLGRISIAAWPARSTIDVDGRPGREVTYVKPGDHHVRARLSTGETLDREVDVGMNEEISLPVVPRVAHPDFVPQKPRIYVTPPPKSKAWVAAVVVAAVIVVGGAVGLGVALGSQPAAEPLKGELGTFKFSDFH
jgi:hypothetical protein